MSFIHAIIFGNLAAALFNFFVMVMGGRCPRTWVFILIWIALIGGIYLLGNLR